MKRFNALHALVLSFYSGDFYRDVAKNWTGIGFLYLLMLLSVAWLPSGVRTFKAFTRFVDGKGAAMAQQMPAVTIENGVMRATPSGRHELKEPRTGEIVMIIDDTIDTVPADITMDGAVLTRTEFGTFNSRRQERRVWQLQPAFNFALTRARTQEFLSGLPFWAAPVIYVGLVIGSLAFRFGQALLYGNIGMFFARQLKADIDYRAAVRIAAVAVTPVIVLRTLIWFMPVTEPSWYIRWPIAFVITVLLIRFGVKSAAQPQSVATIPV